VHNCSLCHLVLGKAYQSQTRFLYVSLCIRLRMTIRERRKSSFSPSSAHCFAVANFYAKHTSDKGICLVFNLTISTRAVVRYRRRYQLSQGWLQPKSAPTYPASTYCLRYDAPAIYNVHYVLLGPLFPASCELRAIEITQKERYQIGSRNLTYFLLHIASIY